MNSALTPLAFGLAFVTVTAARSLWLRRTAGVNPYVIDHKDPLLRFVAYLFLVVALGMAGYFFSLALWPQSEQSLGLLAWAKTPATQVVSLVLMSFGVAWTGYAQFAMGNSWRIGIPADAPPLRTTGPFALSRNPIFLGMLLFVTGLTLWSPSAVTSTMLVAAYISIEVQIRCEEVFLEQRHADAYRKYRAKVRRWI
ncbi:MAG: isoprenylcysteine carboxylmethyltransferase family protein [Alphaproteobacteria bacterium]|nr:isoprenylcysteine carboxylmethyltransferase family protein [Alphaproteobacteria bacterium]